jgi:predicted GIY-YIG superfamily endonuclease
MSVYVIQFEHPIGSEKHQAQFYIGYCSDGREQARLKEHQAGRGANITRFVASQGIRMQIVAIFPGYREEEKRLKAQKNTRRIVERYRRLMEKSDG